MHKKIMPRDGLDRINLLSYGFELRLILEMINLPMKVTVNRTRMSTTTSM
jgi:hypothetical protein